MNCVKIFKLEKKKKAVEGETEEGMTKVSGSHDPSLSPT